MTADAHDDDARACRDAGMDGPLTKPIDPARLRAAGLGLARGLRQVGGQPATLLRLLALFRDQHLGDAAALAATADPVAAARRMHRLQGAAAMLGLTLVRRRARLLERAFVRGQVPVQVLPMVAALQEALDRVRLLTPPSSPAAATADDLARPIAA